MNLFCADKLFPANDVYALLWVCEPLSMEVIYSMACLLWLAAHLTDAGVMTCNGNAKRLSEGCLSVVHGNVDAPDALCCW